MQKIKLGDSGEFAIVDDEDFIKVSAQSWYLYRDENNLYARNKNNQRMHRVIFGSHNTMNIDHIDGNGLNNKRDNLRSSTHGQNMANRKVVKKSSSKHLGVYKEKYGWVAGCRKNGKLHRKRVQTEEQAAIEYNKMASEFHGEFARLNVLTV